MNINKIKVVTMREPGVFRVFLDWKAPSGNTYPVGVATVRHKTEQIVLRQIDGAQEWLNLHRKMTVTKFRQLMEPCKVELIGQNRGGRL